MRVIAAILFGLICWLVFVDMARSGTSYHVELKNMHSGLECVHNCDGFNVMLDSLRTAK